MKSTIFNIVAFALGAVVGVALMLPKHAPGAVPAAIAATGRTVSGDRLMKSAAISVTEPVTTITLHPITKGVGSEVLVFTAAAWNAHRSYHTSFFSRYALAALAGSFNGSDATAMLRLPPGQYVIALVCPSTTDLHCANAEVRLGPANLDVFASTKAGQ